MKNDLNEERLADAFIEQWTIQIGRQLRWVSRRRPRNVQNYMEILDLHDSLSIETIEFLDLILNRSPDLEIALQNTPTRYKGYTRRNTGKGPRTIDKSRIEVFIEHRWNVSTKKARRILQELQEFIQLVNSNTIYGYDI